MRHRQRDSSSVSGSGGVLPGHGGVGTARSTTSVSPGSSGTSTAAHTGMVVVLIAGRQSRVATKWAWFWLSFLPLGWAVFLLVEPVPA